MSIYKLSGNGNFSSNFAEQSRSELRIYLEVDGDSQLFCPLDVSDELLGLQGDGDGGVDDHFQWKLKEISSALAVNENCLPVAGEFSCRSREV